MFLDLGKYRGDYFHIYRLKKIYDDKVISDDSPSRIYSALKGEERVILKVFDKDLLKKDDDYDLNIDSIQKEIELNNLCNSDYIIKLNRNFEIDKNIILELEYYDSDLKEYFFYNDKLETKIVGKDNLQIFKEIAIAIAKTIKYIHDKGVVHRNIKPENIYIELDKFGKKLNKIKKVYKS